MLKRPILILIPISFLLALLSFQFPIEQSRGALAVTTYTKAFNNIHFAESNGKLLMFDTGNVGDAEKIEKALLRKGIDLSTVDYLIITHGHADHAGNAYYFQQKYGMKVIAGKGENTMIANGGEDPDVCPRGLTARLIIKFMVNENYVPFKPDILVNKELDLNTLGINGKIIEVPGHTPESIVTFIGDKAFVGDLIKGKNLNKRKPEYHLFMCDLEDNLKDIESIANEPNIQTWMLGHLGPLDIKDVKKFIKKEKK